MKLGVSRFGRPLFQIALAAVSLVLLVARVTAANAPAGRYTIAGGASGTVFDNKTKLTWQRAVSGTKYTWPNAKTACPSVGLSGAGWRLPTIPELLSLVDFSQPSGPYVDPTAFPNTPSDFFWSATPVSGSTANAWPVDFSTGNSNGASTTSTYYIRCVR